MGIEEAELSGQERLMIGEHEIDPAADVLRGRDLGALGQGLEPSGLLGLEIDGGRHLPPGHGTP
jgi:hypothetical protein